MINRFSRVWARAVAAAVAGDAAEALARAKAPSHKRARWTRERFSQEGRKGGRVFLGRKTKNSSVASDLPVKISPSNSGLPRSAVSYCAAANPTTQDVSNHETGIVSKSAFYARELEVIFRAVARRRIRRF